MAGFAHESVLVSEVVAALSPRDGGVYCDGTLGGGGHTAAVLATPGTRVIAIDRDPNALAASRARLSAVADADARVAFVHGEFGDVDRLLADAGLRCPPPPIDGFLLDLGVSSPQLDHAERGFSFSQAGPIDMRMNAGAGATALDLMRKLPEHELAVILRDFGEERFHKRIAHQIKEALAQQTLHTTVDLAALISAAIPAAEQRKSRIHPATRTFQALRIAVNGELDQLQRFLRVFPNWLAPGGRCAIISFHSLEDRLVKHAFRELAWTSSLPPVHAVAAGERVAAVCTPISKKPIEATDEEVAKNPRARSAKLRVCERTAAPNLPTHQQPGAL